ncbi:hypothetical protein MNY66_10735 [Moellerella wisconsensis]|uniref:hypothetical protein n=1 Tax=Moellerella wisconsensis TaxID=158849 RepID=UPI001F4ED703|nr:hypothetical protein [Moellerella wisconsensis]UNH41522.1 hypothetical protein MNY66_10735 [Moellerella wisconsensis]
MSGIKITFAYDSNGIRVDAESYGALPIAHPLISPDKNAEAFLEHVNGYKRESYGKQQFILSISPKTEQLILNFPPNFFRNHLENSNSISF